MICVRFPLLMVNIHRYYPHVWEQHVRFHARSDEKENLVRAKTVLSGGA